MAPAAASPTFSTQLSARGAFLLNGAFVDTLHWRHLWFVAALIWAGASRFQTRDAA